MELGQAVLLILWLLYNVYAIFFIRKHCMNVYLKNDKNEKDIKEGKKLVDSILGDSTVDWEDLQWMMSHHKLGVVLEKYTTDPNSWTTSWYSTSGVIGFIKYRTYENVLYTSHTLYDISGNVDQIAQRRYLTISAALFKFKIPKHLVLIDEITFEILAKYIICTLQLDVPSYLETWRSTKTTELNHYSKTELARFFKIISYFSYIHNVLAKYENKRLPNYHVFVEQFKAQYPKTYVVFKDAEEFKLLLTVTMTKAGLMVPRDYLTVNDFIYDHLWCKSKNYNGPIIPDALIEE